MSIDPAFLAKCRQPRWPLIPVEVKFDEEGEADFFLSDSEMIAIKVALRFVCSSAPDDPRINGLVRVIEGARQKIEQALDVELNEGRFAPDAVEGP